MVAADIEENEDVGIEPMSALAATCLEECLARGYVDTETSSISCVSARADEEEAITGSDECEMMVSSLYVGGNCIGCSWNTPNGDPSVLLSIDS